MPLPIRDTRIASIVRGFEAQARTNPSVSIDGPVAVKIAAAAGDRWLTSADSLYKQLAVRVAGGPGISREQQVALVRKGLSGSEKKDLETLLDSNTLRMTRDARDFFEQIVGRQSVPFLGPDLMANFIVR